MPRAFAVAYTVVGLRVAVARAQKPQVAGAAGVPGMQMEVGAQDAPGIARHIGFSRRICSTFDPAPR